MKKIVIYVKTLLVILLLYQCDTSLESVEVSPSFHVVNYNALPNAIQAKITATDGALKNADAHEASKPFGRIVKTRIHQRIKSNGNTSYTFALRRMNEGLYYDNLVINEDPEGNLKSYIIRYQPDEEWFYQHKTEGLGYKDYSGDIHIFNDTGAALSSVRLVSGVPQKTTAEATALKTNEVNCEVIDIQEAGLLQDGVFYVYEITITVDCSETGNGGGYDDGLNDDWGNGDTQGGGGGGGNTGGAGVPVDTVPVEESVIIIGPDTPINDVADYFNCFDNNQNATLTVYVDEPIPGSGNTHDGTLVGHAFVSISQGSNTSVYGFYPTSNWITPGINNSSNSVLGDDGNSSKAYSASISTTINGDQLQQIIDFSVNFNPTYHLDNYNCTDFAIDIGNIGGLDLPEANGIWPGGGGSNPGTLGLLIRTTTIDNAVINTNGGNAPSTNKGC